ncbi:MAG: hypothetical protein JWQ89_3324, partial [Devosia sp.]|uniref:hypothetical protein n=1 Tax=Devosia sp. TaxID=1871048 RepID=UPI002610DA57
MDQSNYVGQTGAGYVVVKGGQVVGTYPTQSAAEQAYNGGGGGGAAPTNNGPVYQTRNGPRTLQQMTAELQSAGGNQDPSNPDAVFAMYQGVDPNGVGGAAGATGGNTAVNIAAANAAAAITYQTGIIAGMSDRLAFD